MFLCLSPSLRRIGLQRRQRDGHPILRPFVLPDSLLWGTCNVERDILRIALLSRQRDGPCRTARVLRVGSLNRSCRKHKRSFPHVVLDSLVALLARADDNSPITFLWFIDNNRRGAFAKNLSRGNEATSLRVGAI